MHSDSATSLISTPGWSLSLGESENAVRIQLLTALIAYLLVALLKITKRLAEFRTGLFLRIEEETSQWRRRRHRQAIISALQPSLFL